jgi:hypothetical protein
MVTQEDRPLAIDGMSGVCRMISTMGWRSSWAMAMYMRGMSGK